MKVIDFKSANCKHCYKCVRSCSVKAIRVQNAQAKIMENHCILCGTCLEVCPQNAKTFISDIQRVKKFIANRERTVVSLAPSYLGIAHYDKPGQVTDALLKLGFSEVRETSEGAAYVTNAFARLMEEGRMKNIISTCCPSVNDLVEKYYPQLTSYLAPVVSPVIAHGRLIKSLYGPDTKVVFIGPCIAKKKEAEGDARTAGAVDAVLDFDELDDWLRESGINILECDDIDPANPNPEVNRLYPVSGGIVSSVLAKASQDRENSPDRDPSDRFGQYKRLYVDGIEDCRALFQDMTEGRISGCFIEANMCEGGCINGPAAVRTNTSRFRSKIVIEDRVQEKAPDYPDFIEGVDISTVFSPVQLDDHMPSEEQIGAILRATGKFDKSQELNCGACGYSTCREKAIAVFQGKAEQEMCLPYVYEKAQSMANVILDKMPDIVIVVNSSFEIIEFNKRAEYIFGISRAEALGRLIFEFIEADDINEVLRTGMPSQRKKIRSITGDHVLQGNIVYMKDQEAMLAIYRDITEEETELERQMRIKMDTVDVAQKVIDRQMMAAQEIAGLLGETTAETKVILTQLRDSMLENTDIRKDPESQII